MPLLALLFAATEICAASSFTDVAPKLAAAAKITATYRFESSAKIAKLVEAGARCDVVLLADDIWAKHLADKQLTRAYAVFASNTLVLIAPKEAAEKKPKRVAMAGESVPAGRYAKQAMDFDAEIVRGENVRTVLVWVARGEVDAGFVYATDARVEPKVKIVKSYDVPIALTAAARSDDGALFVAFLKTELAQKTLKDAGFR